MPNPFWSNIPDDALDLEKNQRVADDWAKQQHAVLAQQWQDAHTSDLHEMLAQYGIAPDQQGGYARLPDESDPGQADPYQSAMPLDSAPLTVAPDGKVTTAPPQSEPPLNDHEPAAADLVAQYQQGQTANPPPDGFAPIGAPPARPGAQPLHAPGPLDGPDPARLTQPAIDAVKPVASAAGAALVDQIDRTNQDQAGVDQRASDIVGKYGRGEPISHDEMARSFEDAANVGMIMSGEPLALTGEKVAAGALNAAAGAVKSAGGPGIIERAKDAATRMFHGTGSAFDKPDAGKFDQHGLYGPGYYLTSDPRVAGDYAKTRATDISGRTADISGLEQDIARAERGLAEAKQSGKADEVAAWQDQLDQTRDDMDAAVGHLPSQGPNVRAVDVPEGINLLEADKPATVADVKRVAAVLPPDDQSYFLNGIKPYVQKGELTGHDIYEWVSNAVLDPAKTNDVLAQAGYDGVRYDGGKRVPMKDETGQAIAHDAVAIFPHAMEKLTNAISGTQGGSADINAAIHAGGAAAGGAAGYASAEPQREGESDADYRLRVAGRTAAGAGAGGLLAAGATSPELGRLAREAVGGERSSGIGPASRYQPEPGDFAAKMQAAKDAAQGGERYRAPTGPAAKTSMRDMEAYYAKQEAKAPRSEVVNHEPPANRLADALDDAPPAEGPRPGEEETIAQLQARIDAREAKAKTEKPPRTPQEPVNPGKAAPELGPGAQQKGFIEPRGPVDPGKAAPEIGKNAEQADFIDRGPRDPGTPAGPLGTGSDVRVPKGADQRVIPGFEGVATKDEKPSLYDRFQTVRFAGMLSGTATQLLNNTGNAVNTLADVGMKPLQAALDAAVSKATGSERTRYMAEVIPQAKANVAGLLAGAQKIPHILATGVDPESAAKYDLPRKGLQSGSKRLDAVVEMPLRALSAADAMWRGAAEAGHAAALATRQAIKEGLTGAERQKRVDYILSNMHEFPKLGEQAKTLAARTVFQEHRSEIDPVVNALKNTPAKYVADVVLPFIRTPYNVAAQGIGMTPAGFVAAFTSIKGARSKAAAEARLATGARLSDKEMRALALPAGQTGEAVDRVVRAAVGTAALGYGLSLAAGGYITGASPDDPATRSTLPDGWKPYSFRVPMGDGAVYVPLQMLGPVAMPLGIASGLADMYRDKKGGADGQKLAFAAVKTVGKYAGNQMFLQGLAALPNIIDNPSRYLESTLESVASSVMPYSGLQKQIDQALGRSPRDPNTAAEAFLAASPLTSQRVQPRVNALGKEQQPVSGAAAMVTGSRISAERSNPTLAAMREAKVGISAPPKEITLGGSKVPLSGDEQRAYQRYEGDALEASVGKRAAQAEWATYSPAKRQMIIKAFQDAAREQASAKLERDIGGADLRQRMKAAAPAR